MKNLFDFCLLIKTILGTGNLLIINYQYTTDNFSLAMFKFRTGEE